MKREPSAEVLLMDSCTTSVPEPCNTIQERARLLASTVISSSKPYEHCLCVHVENKSDAKDLRCRVTGGARRSP